MGAACCHELAALREEERFDRNTSTYNQLGKPERGQDDAPPDGVAAVEYPDGSRYEGEWKGGLFSGQGKYARADGSGYDGAWLNGKAHGFGVYHAAECTYSGQWEQDLKHGAAE